jgi:hypothetical protein
MTSGQGTFGLNDGLYVVAEGVFLIAGIRGKIMGHTRIQCYDEHKAQRKPTSEVTIHFEKIRQIYGIGDTKENDFRKAPLCKRSGL